MLIAFDQPRRRYLAACFVLLVGSLESPALPASETAVELGTGTRLLVDDALIARKEGVVRRAHACTKLPEPVMVSEKPWEQEGDDRRIYVYGTVLRDEATGMLRLWYNRGQHVLLATSSNGLKWQRPALGNSEAGASRANNIVFSGFHSPSVVYSEREPDPERRYQMLGYGEFPKRGYHAAHSPDGIHWQLYAKNPILPGGDTCTLALDPKTGEYLAFHKLYREHRGNRRRLVYLATSRNMQDWSAPVLVMAPDETDDAQVRAEGGRYSQFYNMSAFPYAGQFLGLVTHFHYSGPPAERGPLQSGDDGKIDVQLVHSRDGRAWSRCEDRSPVIPNGPGAYDAGCILGVTNGVVTAGNEIWAYYTAITTTHAGYVPKKQITIGRAAWRVDGFVSLDADRENGVVETVLLAPRGDRLAVNADIEGGLQVAVVDAKGETIAGYYRDDCDTIRGDSVCQPVRWKSTDRLPAGQPIRLRFHLDRAKLFSFRVMESS